MNTYFTIEERLTRYQTGLTNARNVSQLSSRVGIYGYDADKLDALLSQTEAVLNAHILQQKEYGDQYAATQALDAARRAADGPYMHLIKLGRVIFKDDYATFVKLTLHEARKDSFSGWYVQAQTFFTNLLGDAATIAKYAQYNTLLPALQGAHALVIAAEQANALQMKEKAEAQNATRARDAQLDALGKAMSEFYALARLACEDMPQLLEMLDIVVDAEKG